jgi:uncharacterized membrane protein YbhN (UPF0104 family)
VKKYWRVVGSVVLVSVLAWRLDWRQVGEAFARLDATYWLLALGLYFFAQGVSTLRWQMLAHMAGLGGRFRDYLAYYFMGMFFNLILPTSVGGDVVRVWYLARHEGVAPPMGRRKAAFLSVFADRANGLLVLIALACLASACCPLPLKPWIAWTVAGMGAAALVGLLSLPLVPWLQKIPPADSRLGVLLAGAAVFLSDRRGLGYVSLLSLVGQVANVLLGWLVGAGLGLPIPPLYYGVFIPVVAVLTLLPISLNGMGLREAGTVVLLEPLGVGSAPAVTLSLLLFAVYTAASLAGGVFYLLGRSPRFEAAAAGGEAAELLPVRPSSEVPHDDPVRGDPHQGRMRQPPAAA